MNDATRRKAGRTVIHAPVDLSQCYRTPLTRAPADLPTPRLDPVEHDVHRKESDMRNHLLFAALGAATAMFMLPAAAETPVMARAACGGVGHFEQQEFKAAAPRHDAMLTFASPSGAYLADVEVKITSEDGRVVLHGTCEGPLMLVDVPKEGRYHVTATFDGREVHRVLHLGQGSKRALFTWNVG